MSSAMAMFEDPRALEEMADTLDREARRMRARHPNIADDHARRAARLRKRAAECRDVAPDER